MARRGVGMARGLRALVRDPVTVRRGRGRGRPTRSHGRGPRFLRRSTSWCGRIPTSPTRRLLTPPGSSRADVARSSPTRASSAHSSSCATPACTCRTRSTTAGSRRGGGARRSRSRRPTSSTRSSGADYLATTGGSRSTGTPVELSFAWQRRQGVPARDPVRPGRRARRADRGLAAGVPVGRRVRRGHEDHRGRQPSGAVVLAGSRRPRGHQQPQAAREPVPRRRSNALARTRACRRRSTSPPRIPSPSCAGSSTRCTGTASPRSPATPARSRPRRVGRASTASTLDGVVAYPSSEPVTVGKLDGDAGRGHAAVPDVRIHSRRHDGPELRRVRRRGVPPLGPRARGDHPPAHAG